MKEKTGEKMKKKEKLKLFTSISLFLAFVLWTLCVRFVDVKAIGPRNSSVGFATLNSFIHNLAGVNMNIYILTDWLGIVPLLFCFGFAILGLIQWIKRKSLSKVDYDILVLGAFYVIVITAYVLFEIVVINHRPVLINGYLEISYPSSTTMLVACVMPTSIMQFNCRIKSIALKKSISITIYAFIIFMVGGRLISGVHWFSDIFGGLLLSISLIKFYDFFIAIKVKRE